MAIKLDVVRGDKVGQYSPASFQANCKEGAINAIYTVVGVGKKGIITVETDPNGKRYQYDSDGWGRGSAPGRIRRLREREEEEFQIRQKEQEAKTQAEKQQKETERAEWLEECRLWIKMNDVSWQKVWSVNCALYIVGLPIPRQKTTLVLRFDYREDRSPAYFVHISTHRTLQNDIVAGMTSITSDSEDPLEVAAQWMAKWIYGEDLRKDGDILR